MKKKTKLICAFRVICIPSIVFAQTLVRSEKYRQLNGDVVGFNFSSVNLGPVQSQLQCFQYCNSDDNCRGVGLVEETGEKKGLNCFMMKNESASQVASQEDVQIYIKGNTRKRF